MAFLVAMMQCWCLAMQMTCCIHELPVERTTTTPQYIYPWSDQSNDLCSCQFSEHTAKIITQFFCPFPGRRNKKQYKQSFQRGAATSELKETSLKGADAKKTGTKVRFLYDKTIFTSGLVILS